MEISVCSYLISCLILASFLFDGIGACWGKTAPDDADMTGDYDLVVGSDLVLNCTLKKWRTTHLSRTINSSNLVIKQGERDCSEFTRVINNRTIQLTIPKATSNDTGLYICMIKENKFVLCGSKVNVGYPPHHIKEFSCISRNFDNLNCTWSVEENKVYTTYTIVKLLYNIPSLLQKCPESTASPDSCEWSTSTDPIFAAASRYMDFTITGNNSLGRSVDNFTVDIYSIVIPNSPEELEMFHVDEQSAIIRWQPPSMTNAAFRDFSLKYQIWLSKVLNDSSDVMIYDIDDNSTDFKFENLIPYITYNVSLRCRSNFTEKNDMWSDFISITFKTVSDVPYKSPEVIPEAFEIHTYEESRSASLYWKAVPKLYHNGETFYYHIKYYQNGHSNISNTYVLNSSIPFITIKNLQKNYPYTFEIYSANENGISEDYGSIFIDSADKIPPAPKEVRVISQDAGHYKLTWIPPNNIDNFKYIVFWCSSSKPWLSRCDNSIQWTNERLSETNTMLNLSDNKTNFQFAVASELDTGKSGMEWASCILPHKGGLSKIKYWNVESKNSTTLKVIWNLDCPAEKAVMKRYEITYCGVEKHTECHMVEVADPNADNFILENLHPFTNYSIKIRAINKHNKASEDSDEKYQSTLPGAPSGSPQDIQVSSIRKNSFFISWTPPLEPNGVITEYIVSYGGDKKHVYVSSFNESEYNMTIDGLKPFHMYAVQIQACVNHDCSIKSEPIMIQTEIGEPGVMEPPVIYAVNSTHVNASWRKPVEPNGRIDFYEIKWHHEKQNATSVSDNIVEVFGSTSVVLDVKCPPLGNKAITYLFYVRAVNRKNGTYLYGNFSDSAQVTACSMPEGLGMFVGTIVGATFGAIFFLIVIYRFTIWMKLKIHQYESFTPKLPKGLDGPETNSLNNYEGINGGVKGNLESINDKKWSYAVDENKNRHGSGSSQYSNSSSEEMPFRNGKCSTFARKPSGDSSGCSSLTSSITPRINLSSDSGNESDFVVTPTPDSGITEHNLYNNYKIALPTLIEVNDQHISEKNAQPIYTISPEKQNQKHKNILKVDPFYSKFGYAGNVTSSVPSRVNPLTFYNCNLANSEPSVFGTEMQEKDETVLAPYSKVGLAKSTDNIGLDQNGYSKFGFSPSQKRFSIPPPNFNVIAMVMLEDPDKKGQPTIKKLFNERCSQNKNKDEKMMPSNNLEEDTGYIKVGKSKICANTPSKGYVPFNEIRNQMDHNQSFMMDNSDQTKTYNSSLTGKDQNYFPDGSEWSPFNHNEEEHSNADTPESLYNVPFSQNSSDCIPLDGTVFTTDNYSCTGFQNSDDSLPKVSFDSDIKLNSDSPTISLSEINFESNATLQQNTGSLPSSIMNPTENSVSEESHLSKNTSNKCDRCDIPNEVIMTPMTLRNGYVPFHSLSDSMCDETLSYLPNNSKLTNTQNSVPHGICSDTDECVTSTHKGDLKLLRQNSLSKTLPIESSRRDSLSDTQKCFQNGNGYASLSLNYILKPLPKMESEICEV